MPHGVFHQRLDEERRDEKIFHLWLYVHFHGHAVFPEPRDLEREVAQSLLDLAGEQDEIGRVFQRPAVEHGELAQQHARLFRVGADKRGDGVDGVEQEMRVDLALQGLQLHAGGQLRLFFQRGCGHLSGQQLAEPFGDGLLRLADMVGTPVVELERALHARPHHQRHDDGGPDGAGARREPDVFGREQHAHLAIGDGGVGGMGADVSPRRVAVLFRCV